MPDDFKPLSSPMVSSQNETPEETAARREKIFASLGKTAQPQGDDFKPLGQADMTKFAETPKAAKKKEEPKSLGSRAWEFVGGAPGVAGAGSAIVAAALAPETGGLSLAIPALAAAGGAGLVAKMTGYKDPLLTGISSGVGELAGGVGGKVLGKLTSKALSKWDMAKYVGNIGEKLSGVFGLPPMKTAGDIYQALHVGEAAQALSKMYRDAQQAIFDKVGADTPVDANAQRFLNRIFYNHVPEFKQMIDGMITQAQAARPSFVSRYSSFRGSAKTQAADMLNRALDTTPLTVENALEFSRLLGGASVTKRGSKVAIRDANKEARTAIADALDRLAPGDTLSRVYTDMNTAYRRGSAVLDAFKEKKLFDLGPGGGAKLNRVEWQKASDAALANLRKVSLEDLDAIIRYNRPPGFVGKQLELHGTAHTPVQGIRAWLPNVKLEIPLRSQAEETGLRKFFSPTGPIGANVGAQAGE